jgi:hypothetical protein
MNRVTLVLGAALAVLAAASPAMAKERKAPPACAAVSFRPFAGPLSASPVTAGHYRSRFGSIDLLGAEESGGPNYRVVVNNKPLTPLQGEVPKSAYGCLNSKHIKTPPQAVGGPCVGSRFRVAIDSSGKGKLVMLYALKGDDWKLCQAGTPAG